MIKFLLDHCSLSVFMRQGMVCWHSFTGGSHTFLACAVLIWVQKYEKYLDEILAGTMLLCDLINLNKFQAAIVLSLFPVVAILHLSSYSGIQLLAMPKTCSLVMAAASFLVSCRLHAARLVVAAPAPVLLYSR